MGVPGGKTLIVGIGNELLGDEGLGVHVARSLAAARGTLPSDVDVLEAGTSLFDVLPEMARYSRVILVDAVQAGGTPGSIYFLTPEAGATGPPDSGTPLSLHGWGVAETLRAAAILELMPEKLMIVGVEPESLNPGTELSPKLALAAEKIAALLSGEATFPAD